MKVEVLVLGKNHYDMEGQRGANLVLYGDYEETNNKAGISISQATIDYDDHSKLTVFPAKYRGDASFISIKNRSGKDVTGLRLSNLEFVNKVDLVKAQ